MLIFNINSPSYYTSNFGIIDEIYTMCQNLSNELKYNDYSDYIDVIGITPIIAPKEMMNSIYKEMRKCELKYRFASVSLFIDFDQYYNSSINDKKKLIIQNILNSVKSISKRAKINFADFEKDVKIFCQKNSIII